MFSKIIRRLKALFGFFSNVRLTDFSHHTPLVLFNHIPKCGGSSLRLVLRHWFWVITDYRTATGKPRKPIRLERLRRCHCVCGHYLGRAFHFGRKYPDILEHPDNYRVISYVRDPLSHKISHYFHRLAKGRTQGKTLAAFLFSTPNYAAGILGCDADNYKEVIDAYFFVGCLEENEKSIQVLATLLGKSPVLPKHLNRGNYDPFLVNRLDPVLANEFKKLNHLDYLIHAYCKEKVISRYNDLFLCKRTQKDKTSFRMSMEK